MEPETTNANGNEVLDMADKTYSIKELADQAHVTKSAIRKLMTQTFRKQYTSVSGNRILIDDAGAKIILGHFANPGMQTTNEREPQTKNENTSSQTADKPHQGNDQTANQDANDQLVAAKDAMIQELREQLKVKDQQINGLHRLMDQNQQLLLHNQQETHQLLGVNNEDSKPVKPVTGNQDPQTETADEAPKGKKSFWQRVFGN